MTTPDDANWWSLKAARAGQLVLVWHPKSPPPVGVIQQWARDEWEDLLNAVKLGAHHVAIDVLSAEHVHVKFGLHRHEPLYFDRVEWNAFIRGVHLGEFKYELLPSYASTLSSPVPVSGGLQVDGANEVGVGGGSNQTAATGAGGVESAPGEPVPVAVDRQIATIKAHFTRRIDTLLARAERAEQQLAVPPVPVAAPELPACDRDCPAAGKWGATGRLPEGHVIAQVGTRSYLAHAVPPVPVAAHHHTAGWGGVPGQCGVECACGWTLDGFDTIAEAAALLDDHIAAANPEISDETDCPHLADIIAGRAKGCHDDSTCGWCAAIRSGTAPPVPVAAQPLPYPEPGSAIPDMPGFVVGECGHRLAGMEWRAGFRVCERCPKQAPEPDDKALVLFENPLDKEVYFRDDALAAECRGAGSPHTERWFQIGNYDDDPMSWANVLKANPDEAMVLLMRADAPETSADSRLREAAVRAAGIGEADPVLRNPGAGSADPFTMSLPLCDDDGIVRQGAMHHGTDYPCTGSAHYAGEHIRCNNRIHNLPGTGSAVPDREEIERRDRLAESWAEDD